MKYLNDDIKLNEGFSDFDHRLVFQKNTAFRKMDLILTWDGKVGRHVQS
jgi:hypothetical protein